MPLGAVIVAKSENATKQRLQVLRRQPRLLCDASQHARPNLFPIVKSENAVRPIRTAEDANVIRQIGGLIAHPLRSKAASTRLAFAEGQRLMRAP